MNAKELRIGNLIFNRNSIVRVNYKRLGGIISGNKEFSPIPLTEEWLLKFGFKKAIYESTHDDFCDEICYELEYKRDFFMSYADDFSLTLFIEKKTQHEELGICPNLKDLRNVHQLQNLYFALTSEELEIK